MTEAAILSIDERTLLLAVSFRRFGQQRKIDQSEYEVGTAEQPTDKRLTSASRRRLDSAALRRVDAHDSMTVKLLARRTLPALIRTGLYRVAVDALGATITFLEARAAERRGLVEEFRIAYPTDRDATIRRLGAIGHGEAYPTADAAAQEFGMSWRLLSGGVPAQLASVDAALDAQERLRYRQHLERAADTYKSMLRIAASDLVRRLHGQLATNGDKVTRVYDSAFTNLREFMQTFPGRNVADDSSLDALLNAAGGLISAVGADQVRDDDTLRQNLAAQFGTLADGLDRLVDAAGGRKRRITLED